MVNRRGFGAAAARSGCPRTTAGSGHRPSGCVRSHVTQSGRSSRSVPQWTCRVARGDAVGDLHADQAASPLPLIHPSAKHHRSACQTKSDPPLIRQFSVSARLVGCTPSVDLIRIAALTMGSSPPTPATLDPVSSGHNRRGDRYAQRIPWAVAGHRSTSVGSSRLTR